MTPRARTASVFHAMSPHTSSTTTGTEGSVRGEMAGMDTGMRVLSYLIAGVLVYGGLGWVGDHYLGTGFLLPIGIVLGAAGGCYVIIRRYGRVPDVSVGPSSSEAPEAVRRTDDEISTNKWEGAR
jgi:F0F1-type ATP synthase assembly protein I